MNPFQFSLVSPPQLRVYDRLTVLSFVSDWEKYKADVGRLNSALPADKSQYFPVPMRDCIESFLLYTICVLENGVSESKLLSIPDDELLDS